MVTIKEDYVSFEIAKLLKEKGFDEQTVRCYNLKKELCACQCNDNETINSTPNYLIAAPTHQMVMKLLREKHNLFIQITVDFSDGAYPMYDVYVVDLARGTSITVNGYNRYSYKQACETAIKYCLENLI